MNQITVDQLKEAFLANQAGFNKFLQIVAKKTVESVNEIEALELSDQQVVAILGALNTPKPEIK